MKRSKKGSFVERRSYIRIQTPLSLTYTTQDSDQVQNVITKDVSANGVRFESADKTIKITDTVEIKLLIPDAKNPVHAKGAVIWRNKISLEDAAPFDTGIEFVEIEEDNKNTFLKFLCDYLYKWGEDKTKCGK